MSLSNLLQLSCSISLVHRSEFVPSASHPIGSNSFKFHADFQALLKPAVGTALSLGFVDLAVAVRNTCVHFLVLHSPFEEALARFTGQEPIVVTRDFVPTDRASLLHEALLGIREVPSAAVDTATVHPIVAAAQETTWGRRGGGILDDSTTRARC
jgi:hypothetical protein